MKYSLTTHHLELTGADIVLLDKKLERVEKYLKPPFSTDLVLRHDTHHRRGGTVTCIINVRQGKNVFHVRRVGETIQEALDEVIEALKEELKRERDKRRRRR